MRIKQNRMWFRKGIGLAILLVVCNQAVQAQYNSTQIDSLNQQGFTLVQSHDSSALILIHKAISIAKQEQYIAGMASAYHNLGIYNNYRQNFDSASYYVLMGLSLAQSIADSIRVFVAYNTLGSMAFMQGDYSMAEKYYQKATQAHSSDISIDGLGELYLNLAMVHNVRSEYAHALSCLFRGDSLLNHGGSPYLEARYKSSIAMVYMNLEAYEKAEAYYQQALEIYSSQNKKRSVAEVYNNLGVLYDKQNNLEEALTYYQKALMICMVENQTNCEATCYTNIANVLTDMKQYEKARLYIEKALELKMKLQDYKGTLFSYMAMAKVEYTTGNKSAAISFMDSAFLISTKLGMRNEQVQALEFIANAYDGFGAYRKAYDYQRRASVTKDSLYDAEKMDVIARLEAKHQLRQQEQQMQITKQTIDLLNRDKRIKNLQTRMILLLVAILLLVLGIIIYKLLKKNRLKQLVIESKQNLLVKNQKLQQSNLKTFEREKEQLSQELKHNKETLKWMVLQLMQKNDFNVAVEKEVFRISKMVSDASVKEKLTGLRSLVKAQGNVDADREHFQQTVQHLHVRFIDLLKKEFPNLSSDEQKLCIYLVLNLSSKEIATLFGISVSSADMKRYRLRKKLNMKPGEQIQDFIQDRLADY